MVVSMDETMKLIENVKSGDPVASYGEIIHYVVKTKCRNENAKMVVVTIMRVYLQLHYKKMNSLVFL
jgi:hypothetical protein